MSEKNHIYVRHLKPAIEARTGWKNLDSTAAKKVGLNEKIAKQQAFSISKTLFASQQKINKIITSPYERSKQSAALLCSELKKLTQIELIIETREFLREVSFGENRDMKSMKNWITGKSKAGDSLEELICRAQEVLDFLANQPSCLVVGHQLFGLAVQLVAKNGTIQHHRDLLKKDLIKLSYGEPFLLRRKDRQQQWNVCGFLNQTPNK